MDRDKIEKKKTRATRTSGIFAIIIGVLFLLCGIFFAAALKSAGGLIVMLIFSLVFIGAGVYFFYQPKLELKKQAALDDPSSRVYQKRQSEIKKKQEKYISKADKHSSLKTLMCYRAAAIWGFFTILCTVLTLLFLTIGVIGIGLAIVSVMCTIAFIRSIIGKDYRIIIDGFSEHGISREDAEQDFQTSKVYLHSTDIFSVSRRFLIATVVPAVLDINDIVWIFPAFDTVDHYKNGMYSHTDQNYNIIISLKNGVQVKIACPEELCSILIKDVIDAGTMITEGYSNDLQELYKTDPESFRSASKNLVGVILTPVGSEHFNGSNI